MIDNIYAGGSTNLHAGMEAGFQEVERNFDIRRNNRVILLTDGDNNAGEIDPMTAANLAAAFDIKIYTIGAGKPGNALFPYQDPIFGKRYVYQPTRIDEQTLKSVA